MNSSTSNPVTIKPAVYRHILFNTIPSVAVLITISFLLNLLWFQNPTNEALKPVVAFTIAIIAGSIFRITNSQIIISDSNITGPSGWNKVTFPLNEVDKEKSILHISTNRFWKTNYIYSKSGKQILFDSTLFDDSQIVHLKSILESA